ncbi:hypothetical protein AAE478_006187 [Parahypoxylon ruwenzoriense]
MRLQATLAIWLSIACGLHAQDPQCVTLSGGCDGGTAHSAALNKALGRFSDGKFYGGKDEVVMSSALDGDDLAAITYSCSDGSVPPSLAGDIIRSSVQKIQSCPNQCGGISLPGSDGCGIGVLIVDDAADQRCFLAAIDAVPNSADTSIKPSVGSYGNPACFVDSSGSRVLTGGSSVDAKGMTLEKCADLAKQDGWRFAGVEAGGQCFYGDEQAKQQVVNQNECNTVCPGDQSEVCGGENRLLVYDDKDWIGIKSRAEIADQLKDYEALLQEILDTLKLWGDGLKDYQKAISETTPAKARRQDTLNPAEIFRRLVEYEQTVEKDKARMEKIFGRLAFELAIKIAVRHEKMRQAEMEMFLRQITEPVQQQLTRLTSAEATIPEVGAPAEAALEIVTGSIETIGTAAVVLPGGSIVVATGIFAILGSLLETLLDPATSPENPITTPPGGPVTSKPTISSSSTTTSSSCAPTASAKPVDWIVMTSFQISSNEFKDIVEQFKREGSEIKKTYVYEDINYRFFQASINECAKHLLEDSRIIGSLPDNDLPIFDPPDSGLDLREADGPHNKIDFRSLNTKETHGFNISARADGDLWVQTDIGGFTPYETPFHLQALSEPWAKPKLQGANYGFGGYMFRRTMRDVVTVYVLDSGIDGNHIEFDGNIFNYPRDGIAESRYFGLNTNANFGSDHGTCMASYIMGAYSGVDKNARIKSFKVSSTNNPNALATQAILDAVGAALRDFKAEKSQNIARHAIINLSAESTDLSNPDPNGLPIKDPWPDLLDQLWNEKIIVVHSAGNFKTNVLSNLTPPKHAETRPGLIVVGLSNSKDAAHSEQTQVRDSRALTVYAYAHHAPCASSGKLDEYQLKTGTSGAAALVSGIVSIMVAEGVDPAVVKERLQLASLSRKDGIRTGSGLVVPIAAMDVEEPCDAAAPVSPAPAKPVITSKDQIPILTAGRPQPIVLGGPVNNVFAMVSCVARVFDLPGFKYPANNGQFNQTRRV